MSNTRRDQVDELLSIPTLAAEIARLQREVERLNARCDKIANECLDTATSFLANYTHAVGELSGPRSMPDVIGELEVLMEAELERMDCPKQEARRERFRNMVHVIAIEQKNAENARLRAENAALRAAGEHVVASWPSRLENYYRPDHEDAVEAMRAALALSPPAAPAEPHVWTADEILEREA